MDYNITTDAKQHVSVMGALRNDSNPGAAFYPGLPPSQSNVNYNKGIVVNYNGVITSNLINNFRYGFVRQSVGLHRELQPGLDPPPWTERSDWPPGGNHAHVWLPTADAPFRGRRVLDARQAYLAVWRAGSRLSGHEHQLCILVSFARANASWTTTSGYAQKSSSH